MKRPYPHKRRERILPSFPNNRLSSRPGKRKARKQTFVEDELTTYNQVPESAVSTPRDMPNPTDNAPSFSQTMNYSDAGGFAPVPVPAFGGSGPYANSSREVWAGLSPTTNDTDGDGLFDGPNIAGSYSLDGKAHAGEGEVLGTAYDGNPYTMQGDTNGDGILDSGETWLETNPLNPDTDGDSANDGQEAIYGYDLTWMRIKDDGTVVDNDIHINRDRTILGLISQNVVDPTNDYRDIDGDGLPDYYEANYREFYSEFETWAYNKEAETTNRQISWNNTWGYAIEHADAWIGDEDERVESIEDTGWWDDNRPTKGEFREDYPEPAIFNAQQYLDGQFNPFTRETTPPIIVDFYANTITDWTKAWTEVDLYVTEVSGYSVTITVMDNGNTETFTGSGGVNNHHYSKLRIKYWSDAAWKYRVEVVVSDNGGNTVSDEVLVKSAVAGIVDAIVAVFVAALEVVADAVEGAWVKPSLPKIYDFWG